MEDPFIEMMKQETIDRTKRHKEMIHEIETGLYNIRNVIGWEYKKYMVYALFDYLCDIKSELRYLNEYSAKIAEKVNSELDTFIVVNNEKDKQFHDMCNVYKTLLNEWLSEVETNSSLETH